MAIWWFCQGRKRYDSCASEWCQNTDGMCAKYFYIITATHHYRTNDILEVCPVVFIWLCSKYLLQLFFVIIFYQLLSCFSSLSLSNKYPRCGNMYFFHFLVNNTHRLWVYHSHHINNAQMMFTNVKYCLTKTLFLFPFFAYHDFEWNRFQRIHCWWKLNIHICQIHIAIIIL